MVDLVRVARLALTPRSGTTIIGERSSLVPLAAGDFSRIRDHGSRFTSFEHHAANSRHFAAGSSQGKPFGEERNELERANTTTAVKARLKGEQIESA